jgi:rod shape-determining protein MreC
MTRSRQLVALIAGMIVLALFVLTGFVRPVREGIMRAVMPFARFTSSIGAGLGRALHVDEEARVANERSVELEARVRSLAVDYVRLRVLEEENRSLCAQASFIQESGLRSLGARVIARELRHNTAAVTIDRGARDGLVVGQAVVTDEGVLAGKVFTIGERSATVLLVSDVRSRVAASAAGSERLSGVVEGKGNGTARFTLIPQSLVLKRDDVVVTAGTEDHVPGHIVIGLVNAVEGQATDPFKSAAIEPLAALDRLELVSVILTD